MKLKNKKYIILIVAFIYFTTDAQEISVKIGGIVKNDSIVLQDINIINKTKKLGTSSDKNGEFTIYAKEGDSILFSSVAYNQRIIKISKNHLENKKLVVYLELSVNELNEIMIEQKMLENWSNFSVQKGTILNNDDISSKKPPSARKLTDPTYGNSGIDFISIFKLLTSKSRQKRKEKKQEQKNIQFLKNNFSEKINALFGQDFFINALDIKKDEIYIFLDYCDGNGLHNYYNSDEFLIKDFLVKQSKKFKQIKE